MRVKATGVVSLIVLSLLVFVPPTFAQNQDDRYEVFVGYSYQRADFGRRHVDLGGGAIASGAYRVNDWLAAVGEWSTHHDSKGGANVDTNLFLFGPRVYLLDHERFQPFAHGLFGVHTTQVGFPGRGSIANSKDTGFVFAPGAGVDIRLNENFWVRALQADYLVTDVNIATGPAGGIDQFTDNVRLSSGIVFRWGE